MAAPVTLSFRTVSCVPPYTGYTFADVLAPPLVDVLGVDVLGVISVLMLQLLVHDCAAVPVAGPELLKNGSATDTLSSRCNAIFSWKTMDTDTPRSTNGGLTDRLLFTTRAVPATVPPHMHHVHWRQVDVHVVGIVVQLVVASAHCRVLFIMHGIKRVHVLGHVAGIPEHVGLVQQDEVVEALEP